MANSDDFVDFGDYDEIITSDEKQLSPYNMKNYTFNYDHTTLEYYRVIRERKLNVFLSDCSEFDHNMSFQYKYRWDAYSGKIIDIDTCGPLCFHPDDLIRYFYLKRLDMLWTAPVDETSGYFHGYYGDAVGAGENIFVAGRGEYPERYLFRLPVTNCYVPTTHHLSTITMGPILTNDDVAYIDKLATTYHPNNYINQFKKHRPSLSSMKALYDQAISKNPDISAFSDGNNNCSDTQMATWRYQANINAVNNLAKL